MSRVHYTEVIQSVVEILGVDAVVTLGNVRVEVWELEPGLDTRFPTKPTLYTTRTGGTTKTNPFFTNDFGQVEFYTNPGRYEIELVDQVTPKRIVDRVGSGCVGWSAVAGDHNHTLPDSRLVVTASLTDLSVTTPKLADTAVTTPKITDAAVTTPKLGDTQVTPPKLDTELAVDLGVTQGSTKRRGSAINSAEVTRSSAAAYGLFSAPDLVSGVVLPADGLLLIQYSAEVKTSGADPYAAIFLGANQLKAASQSSAAPIIAEAQIVGSGYQKLVSWAGGLISRLHFSAGVGITHPTYSGDVTTGQAVSVDQVNEFSDFATTGGYSLLVGGGFCVVEAAAGTYDVSVQFKAASGTITARNRRLRVIAMGF